MKIVNYLLLTTFIASAVSHAYVTPAPIAMAKVQKYIKPIVENAAYKALPISKGAHYLVASTRNMFRGKYSYEAPTFSDFMGSEQLTFVYQNSENYVRVNCDVYLSLENVGFAKQTAPILEEVVNEEQLIVKRQNISCGLVQ